MRRVFGFGDMELLRKLVTEVVGTMFLAAAIGFAVTQNVELAALTIGFALMVVVYAGGAISGAHYNPAVTLALWVRGACKGSEVLPYIVAQLIGAALGWLIVFVSFGQGFGPQMGAQVPPMQGIWLEAVFTFLLVFTILNVAASKRTAGNSYFGLAIGMAVFVGATIIGPVTGGALNPAIGLSPNLMNMLFGQGELGDVWVYLIGPTLGAAIAAFLFNFLNPDDRMIEGESVLESDRVATVPNE